jgi:cysteine-rich repeat protein
MSSRRSPPVSLLIGGLALLILGSVLLLTHAPSKLLGQTIPHDTHSTVWMDVNGQAFNPSPSYGQHMFPVLELTSNALTLTLHNDNTQPITISKVGGDLDNFSISGGSTYVPMGQLVLSLTSSQCSHDLINGTSRAGYALQSVSVECPPQGTTITLPANGTRTFALSLTPQTVSFPGGTTTFSCNASESKIAQLTLDYSLPNGLGTFVPFTIIPAGCTNLPHPGTCGDGKLSADQVFWEWWKECEDGNTNNGDGCTSQCNIEPGYQCDFSNKSCHRVTPPPASSSSSHSGLLSSSSSSSRQATSSSLILHTPQRVRACASHASSHGNRREQSECQDGCLFDPASNMCRPVTDLAPPGSSGASKVFYDFSKQSFMQTICNGNGCSTLPLQASSRSASR